MARRKIDSYGRVMKSTGFYIVRCKCHTFRVEDSPALCVGGGQRDSALLGLRRRLEGF